MAVSRAVFLQTCAIFVIVLLKGSVSAPVYIFVDGKLISFICWFTRELRVTGVRTGSGVHISLHVYYIQGRITTVRKRRKLNSLQNILHENIRIQ